MRRGIITLISSLLDLTILSLASKIRTRCWGSLWKSRIYSDFKTNTKGEPQEPENKLARNG